MLVREPPIQEVQHRERMIIQRDYSPGPCLGLAVSDEHSPRAVTTEERTELASLRRENRELRMERDILKKANGSFRQAPGVVFAWIEAEGAAFPIRMLGETNGPTNADWIGPSSLSVVRRNEAVQRGCPQTVAPILQNKCEKCHRGSQPTGR